MSIRIDGLCWRFVEVAYLKKSFPNNSDGASLHVIELIDWKKGVVMEQLPGGESCWNRHQGEPFIAAGAMNIIQVDSNLSGITEGWHVGQVIHQHGQYYCPHNWVGGLTTIANIHLVTGVPYGHMCELNQTYNPLKWEIFKDPYELEDGILTIPDKPGYGVELIDDIGEKFPCNPGPYYKTNPVFEGTDLPIWWS